MKCNVKDVAVMSDAPCVIEGRLNYKKTSNGSIRDGVFKERWFRLVKNFLFYFRLSELGTFDARSPAGVFVMENSVIQMEHGQMIPFAFSISFLEEPEKRHVLAARTQDAAVDWVLRLRQCSYEYLREQLYLLQSKIFALSGYDPLLLVPRNEGSKLWAPAVPFSTAAACSSSSRGFSCHLHGNGLNKPSYTLDRSHSDALLAHRNRANFTSHIQPRETLTKHSGGDELDRDGPSLISFSPEEKADSDKSSIVSSFSLERSVTTSVMHSLQAPIIGSEVLYSRPAPSPPVRKKSPRLQRANGEETDLIALERQFARTGILDPAGAGPAAPPRRKVTPREMCQPSKTVAREDDLIQF